MSKPVIDTTRRTIRDDYLLPMENRDWLFSLYREYNYCSSDPVYIGLLVWEPRTSPPKGKTSHRDNLVSRTHHLFEHFFEEKNKQNIYLQKFVQGL